MTYTYKKYINPFVSLKLPFIDYKNSVNLPNVALEIPLVIFKLKNTGFTLIELMVTLVIASILMTLAAPSFTQFIANQRVSGQANDLLSDLTFSRSEAIRRGTTLTICKTSDPNASSPSCNTNTADAWTSGRLIFVDTNNSGDHDSGEDILRIRQELDGVIAGGNKLKGEGTSVSGTVNRISFLATGLTNLAAESQLLVCDKRGNSQALAVAIHPLGRARVTAKGKDKNGSAISTCP